MLIDPETKNIRAEIKSFLAYLQNIRQLSPHSVSNYQRDLNTLGEFCLTQNIDGCRQIDVACIRQWVAQLRRKGLSGFSVQRALSACRSFFKYLIKEARVEHNPALGIRAPKSPRNLPKTLDVDQVNQFLSGASGPAESDPAFPKQWLSFRDQTIVELFYSSGLRLAELVSLNKINIDFGQAMLTVTGKGNKTRIVPIGKIALEALQAWLKIRELGKPQDNALFISQRGQRLTTRSVQLRLKKMAQQQLLNQHVHPHMLRHSFASHLLQSSGDFRAVQELLGHANLTTTQVYTHLDFQHLAKVYDQAHPRANRKTKE